MAITKEYKWGYYKVVEGSYTMLPPEKLRGRGLLNYHDKLFPGLKEEIEALGADVANYPFFKARSEGTMKKIVTHVNKRWVKRIEERLKNV